MTEAHDSPMFVRANEVDGMPLCPSTGQVCMQAIKLSELYETSPNNLVIEGLSQTDSGEVSKDAVKLHVEMSKLTQRIGERGCQAVIDDRCLSASETQSRPNNQSVTGIRRIFKVTR